MKTIWRILSSILIPTQLVLALNFAVPAMAAGCDDITELPQAPPSESSTFQRGAFVLSDGPLERK